MFLGMASTRPQNPPTRALYFDDGKGSNSAGWYFTRDGGTSWLASTASDPTSADIDVAEAGVTLNEDTVTTGESNAAAFADILQNQATQGDTILIPEGEMVVANNQDSEFARAIDVGVSEGLAQNLTITGKVAADGTPLSTIKMASGQNRGCYLWEIDCDSGLNLTIQNLELDANARNNSNNGESCLDIQNTDSGAVNNCQVTNVDMRNAYATNLRIAEANGWAFENSTFRDAVNNHGATVSQFQWTEADANASPITFDYCLFRDNSQGNGINVSPGRAIVRDCVSLNNQSAFKGGNESSGFSLDTRFERVRALGFTARGFDTTIQSALSQQQQTVFDDVILDGSETVDEELIDIDGNLEVFVPSGSQALLRNAGGDAIVLRESGSAVNVDGEIQICGSGDSPLELRGPTDETLVWETYNHSGNADESFDNFSTNGASVTINTETTDACDTDIAGVPTASEVGVGTQ